MASQSFSEYSFHGPKDSSNEKIEELLFFAKSRNTFCVTQNNLCYVWGENSYGQLGLGDKKERLTPTLLTLPNNERISFITCGTAYTVCLTENNLCYFYGRNSHFSPALLNLPNDERVSFIACGGYHTICLTESNLCYVWGDNESGQLGLGDKYPRLNPTLLKLPHYEKIYYLDCGHSHTICLTENNLCYVWGRNEYGQLGLGDKMNRYIPTQLTLPNKERFSYIVCGSVYSICLTEQNLCYVWGNNKYGQLGLGDTTTCLIPTLFSLPSNEKINYITCGAYHTICLTENNQCYVWGSNNCGVLGLGDEDYRLIPTLLKLPNNEKIVYIVCGNVHTICLTENNACYVWGWNSYGQLGLGDYSTRLTPTLLTLP